MSNVLNEHGVNILLNKASNVELKYHGNVHTYTFDLPNETKAMLCLDSYIAGRFDNKVKETTFTSITLIIDDLIVFRIPPNELNGYEINTTCNKYVKLIEKVKLQNERDTYNNQIESLKDKLSHFLPKSCFIK